MQKLVDTVFAPNLNSWKEDTQEGLNALFGTPDGRYPQNAQKSILLRTPQMKEDGVSYAALIEKNNPTSGAYGGMSFVVFPPHEGPCMIAMGIGTQGLSPDEEILTRPGHARKVQAIVSWLNTKHREHGVIGWAKSDPVRIEAQMPLEVSKQFPKFASVFSRYGNVIYGFIVPPTKEIAEETVKCFLDLNFEERNFEPLSKFQNEYLLTRQAYLEHITPAFDEARVYAQLISRRFLVLSGPPGTGKTRMAENLLKTHFNNRGESIQFHANTTYESFIGGLAPVVTEGGDADSLGFKFAPREGVLMKWIATAQSDPSNHYLLHIDEINRADLAKVLGESIYLLEENSDVTRTVTLPYSFARVGDRLTYPKNLFLLGTMNSADRSIAILDVAVRRRFGFLKFWPQMSVVAQQSSEVMKQAFEQLYTIFVNHASNDAFALMPGHSYFLANDDTQARQMIILNLIPLLEEYILQGYVAGFEDSVQAYIQWVSSL